MAEYNTSHEGFQRSMKESLTGKAEDAHLYAAAMGTSTFYHIFNNQKLELPAYIKSLEEWRGKISDYEPVVHEFLRDGDQLAARMTGTIKVEGVPMFFESFFFAKVDKESQKLEYLIERGVWGEIRKEPQHGVS